MSLNESIAQDFLTILENVPPEKVTFIYDSIIQSSNDENKFFSQRLNLKMGEIIAKYYLDRDNE